MKERVTAKIFDFFITTKCTLNCKLCAAGVPYILEPHHTDLQVAFQEMEKFFQVFDYVDRIEFIGGEPLMHPDIAEIVKEASKYKDQFGYMRITTNATIVPSEKLLKELRESGCKYDFIVDNYGKLSVNFDNLVKVLDDNHITYRVDVYHGKRENQRFGGWIDFGDFTDQKYSEEQLRYNFEHCTAMKGNFCCTNNGKVFPCCYAMTGYLEGKLPFMRDEYIDLFDDTISLDEKRNIASNFDKKIMNACRFCKSFDTENSVRYCAAEQVERDKI